MASICTGSFLLAQAGLLSGRRATTHWHDTRLFARAFPDITVEPDAIFVRDGDVFTSAGVSSGIDLALALVEMDYGTELVRDVARWLVVYLKRAGGQSQFSVLVEADPPPQSPLRAVTDAVAANPAANHSVKTLAAQASLSTRQLTRLFQSELGTTPARYVEMVRIDAARAALDAGGPSPTPRGWPASAVPKPSGGCSWTPGCLAQGLPGQIPHGNGLAQVGRIQQIRHADAMQHLSPEPIENREADVGAVLGRIEVNPERALAKRGVDHADERVGNHGYIGVRRHDGVEGLLNPGSEIRIGSRFVLVEHCLVARRAGIGKVVGTTGECAGHNDRRLDAPPGQFARIGHGQ